MKLTARIDGLDAFGKALNSIANPTSLKAALDAAAASVQAAAIARLHEGEADQRAASLAVSIAPGNSSATVSTSLDDAWHFEFGSVDRPATPWLEPALQDAQPSILGRFGRWLASPGKPSVG